MYSNITIEQLLFSARQYIKDENEIEMIYSAYLWAKELYEKHNKMRQSGEPYIVHPLSVAFILTLLKLDANTIAAGLLHDNIEDLGTTDEDIIRHFERLDTFEYRGNIISRASYIADLVSGVTNLEKKDFPTREEFDAANIIKILKFFDIRVIFIKLADRLHNMRTLEFKPREDQIRKAKETLRIYVPLARSLGLYEIKNELEDLSLRYLYPDLYTNLERKVGELSNVVSPIVNRMGANIYYSLSEAGIYNRVEGRSKHICGVLKNIINGEDDIVKQYDLWALRVIIKDDENGIDNCYRAENIMKPLYNPVMKPKDYIANPKPNGFQSILTPRRVEGYLVQTQTRTELMELMANIGLAAHAQDKIIDMNDELRKLEFYEKLQEIDKLRVSDLEYIKRLGKDVFHDEIYAKVLKLDGECIFQ